MNKNIPHWVSNLEIELDEVLNGFSDKIAETLIGYSDKPEVLLKKKNPFLFRIRGYSYPEEYAKALIDAGISSSEETKFGNVFEDCGILYCQYGLSGYKSAVEGIDIEFQTKNDHVLIQQKSGENWGNSTQVKKLREQFDAARRRVNQSKTSKRIVCIEGISYGKSKILDKGSYQKLVGPVFWEKISGWEGAYKHLFRKVGEHSGNGLQENRRRAEESLICFLKDNKLLKNKKIDWDNFFAFLDIHS